MLFVAKWKKLLGIMVLVAAQNTMASYQVITDRQPLGKGMVYSWVKYSQRRIPVAIGMSITGSALKTLPEEMQMIDLVPKGKYKVPPYDHFGFDWNPVGHEPPGIYDLPHFDFHFYTISQHVRHNMSCTGADEAQCMKTVDPALVPANYVPTPAAVPMMGWHWIDVTSPEFNGQPFTRTFIYGYYKGVTAFLEPMITLAFLKTKPWATFPVKQSAAVSKNGYYPQNYSVTYSSVKDTYDIALIDLIYRSVQAPRQHN